MRRISTLALLGLLIPAQAVWAHNIGIPHTHDPKVKGIIAAFVIAAFVLGTATMLIVRSRRDSNT